MARLTANANIGINARIGGTVQGEVSRRVPNTSRRVTNEVPTGSRPFDDHLFWVEIGGILVAGFSGCSAISAETEVFEYQEGGLNTHTLKFPVRSKYNNITLKRGIDSGTDLYSWYQACMSGKTMRRNVSIIQYASKPTGNDHAPITEVRRYNLRRAFPLRWTGPELKTDSASTAIESLEFAFEELEIVSTGR